MNDNNPYENLPTTGKPPAQPIDEVVLVIVPETSAAQIQRPKAFPQRWGMPVLLFVATCASTLLVGGPVYTLCLMSILVCHEAGHFIQAQRYGVYSSLPYFIPFPISPIGTLGAVIGMSSSIKDRRALFDIGVTGPLAGLVPTMVFCVLGLQYGSEIGPAVPPHGRAVWQFGEPLLFKFLAWLQFGPLPEDKSIYIGPMAMAGWVGMFITALNLLPIGQLDGGHVLYALLRRKAHYVATFLLSLGVALVVLFGYYGWVLMLMLLILIGPMHPPTGDDETPLGPWRVILGWLTLAFFVVGFTPNPLSLSIPQ